MLLTPLAMLSPGLRIGLAAAAIALAMGYLISWGDRHGVNAHRVARIEREIASANARIAAYVARETEVAIEVERLTAAAVAAANASLLPTDQCTITPTMAAAINKVR